MTDLSVGVTSQRRCQRRPPTVSGDDLTGGASRSQARHSGSSSTPTLTGTLAAEFADLSSPLDETRVFDSWRVFGVSMSASASTAGAVTALSPSLAIE